MFIFGDPGGRVYQNISNVLSYWNSADSTSYWSVASSGGRLTGSSLRATYPSNIQYGGLFKTITSQTTVGAAFAIKPTVLPGTGAYLRLLSFMNTGSIQVCLNLNPNGSLSIYAGNNTGLLGISSAILPVNVWSHLEFKATINTTTGTIELRKNGTTIIGPTGSLNTALTGNNIADTIVLGVTSGSVLPGWTGSQNFDFDDVIFYDGRTTDANGFNDIHDFIGDCFLTWLLPSGAGTTTQFTSSGGANYSMVNEATPDGDTTYVQDLIVNDVDTYVIPRLTYACAVKSIASVHYAKLNNAGTRGIKAELRSGGGNTSHATEIDPGTNYQYYFSNWGQNPNNGSPINWTVVGLDGVEAGQTISS